ncbi:serine palmitoyltransferase small subunit B [Chrysoperla carnea]|uniref:serine palmitoyltransferase small subunit B n=1 Tax=Chrysoperla carnea TaxID=189513 RepID=UPI001D08602D|nr:serine palmitoyltransferase small subunit B [Chrysoperla carnea]
MLKNISKFLHYWYFRYLMVTELYMVEKWERAVINGFFISLLCVLTYFNCTVTLSLTSKLTAELFDSSLGATEDDVLVGHTSHIFNDVSILGGSDLEL